MTVNSTPIPGFRTVPKTGVIFVTTEAQRLGFGKQNDWVNLGQGMPECGALPGATPRVDSVLFTDLAQEYAPVPGIWALREAVADMYNRRFRRGMKSQYTAENVAISAGGRVALARAAASLGSIHLGHFLPDYTAYEELLDIFRLFSPIPIALDEENGYQFSAADLQKEIVGRGLSAILLSNPCNPTGNIIEGQELADWIRIARSQDCALLFDEFYSHYIWNSAKQAPMLSAAHYIDDVDKDPVVIFDGLTKNWRYSGWRIAWTVGPRSVIEAVSSAGSFLDGGAPRPLQEAAIPLLEDRVIDAENGAIQSTFRAKRDLMLNRCRAMGMQIKNEPKGTFYLFADLSKLPAPLSTGMGFFQAALKEKVICVPGEFFDVNPGKRRSMRVSRFHRHVRLSFGPNEAAVSLGCERLANMIERYREQPRTAQDLVISS
jgi:aspartate/methionine/tyrosine aminotransferase